MRSASGVLFVTVMLWALPAGAQATSAPVATAEPDAATETDEARIAREIERSPPPPSHTVYFQYGVAFATESVVSAGNICKDTARPCVLGNGGGITIRAGGRSSGPFYIGGAYEITKQDPNKLYRIALLQQARGEARYYFATNRVTEPYLTASVGVAGYGNEFKVDTFGPAGSFGGGIEYQVTQRTVVGVAIGYRLAYLTKFTDTTGFAREGGVTQLFGLDLVLEQRDSILTSDAAR